MLAVDLERRGINIKGALCPVIAQIPSAAIGGRLDVGSRRRFQQPGAFRRTNGIVNRSANGPLWKDAQESRVRTTNAILSINGRDGADHALEHLIAELTFAARGFGALFSLEKAPLNLPDGRHGHAQTRQQREQIPGSNRSRRGILHRISLNKNLRLFLRRILDELVQFGAYIAKLGESLLRIPGFILRDFDIVSEVVPELAPFRQFRQRQMIELRQEIGHLYPR